MIADGSFELTFFVDAVLRLVLHPFASYKNALKKGVGVQEVLQLITFF